MGNCEGIRALGCRKVTDIDIGDDLPDSSGDAKSECASNNPCAVILLDPIAGAALEPSALPTCSRLKGFNETEAVVDTTLSVGLGGLSGLGDAADTDAPEADAADDAKGDDTLRPLGPRGVGVREAEDPLIVASRLRRSSNGAPPVKV